MGHQESSAQPSPSLSNILDIGGSTRYTLRDTEKSDMSAFENFPIWYSTPWSWFFSTEHFPFPKERDNAQFRSIFLQIFMLRSTFHLPQDLFFVSPLEPCCLSVLVISSELWNGSMGMGMGVGMTDIQNCCVWTDGPSLKYRQGSVRKIFACVRNELLIHQPNLPSSLLKSPSFVCCRVGMEVMAFQYWCF